MTDTRVENWNAGMKLGENSQPPFPPWRPVGSFCQSPGSSGSHVFLARSIGGSLGRGGLSSCYKLAFSSRMPKEPRFIGQSTRTSRTASSPNFLGIRVRTMSTKSAAMSSGSVRSRK
jgi:hypothetical protein